ncbi:MAG: hypothetical protein JJU33_01130 [Phycisphaerales bacterium]|nr:hypothetical protein [Phycisphaerales bacterium]
MKLFAGGVVVGVVLQLAVIGAALVWWSPGHDSIRYFMASPTDSRVLFRVSFWGGERVGLAPENVDLQRLLHQIDPRAQAWWRNLPAGTEEPRARFVDAAGFPFRSVYCVWGYNEAYEDGRLVPDTIESEHLRGGLSLGDIDRGELRVVDNWLAVPLTPLWGGLAGNLVVYSVVGVGLVSLRGRAPGFAGREGRASRGESREKGKSG